MQTLYNMLHSSGSSVPFSFIIASGCTTLFLASVLGYILLGRNGQKLEDADIELSAPEDLDTALYPGGHLSVYFASQTGTAEVFANQLQREGQDHGFLVHVVDLQDVSISHFASLATKQSGVNKAVFLISTYGEGEPTDNSAAIVMELKSLLNIASDEEKKDDTPLVGDHILSDLHFSVFGLGNKQYEKFNAMGKFFDSALEHVGATRLAKIGTGDDDNDLEGDFETWKDLVLWPTLKNRYIMGDLPQKVVRSDPLPETPYIIEYILNGSNMEKYTHDKIHSSSRHYFTAIDCSPTIVKELRNPNDGGSTRHIEFDITNTTDFTYHTADNLCVIPLNPDETVNAVATALKYNLNSVFIVKSAPNHEWHGAPFPQPLTVKECLGKYCDLTSPPRRSDLKLLASYASDPMDKKALLRLSSKEGKTEYKKKILEDHIGLVNLLKLCPSIDIPFSHFIHICPRLQPRYYTISSSSSVHPKSVHITVAVTETIKKDGSIFKGICSSHLACLTPGVSICRVFCRESTFRLPTDTSKPIIMIGPGTGIAPMRALLQERAYQRDVLQKSTGPNILYFGCKSHGLDYLYQDELAEFQKSHVLTELHVAFSRESVTKVYVQHLLQKRSKETWDLLNEGGAYIYVCGGVKMGQDVMNTFKDICIRNVQMSNDDAKTYMEKLASEGRYVQELWA